MKNNSRIAQSLRSLSLTPSLEDESSVETGAAGEGVVKVDLEPAQDVQADGAGAPAEDQDLTTTQVQEDKGPTEEAAETVSEDSPAVAEQVSTESDEASASEAALEPNAEQAAAADESSVVTGDGEQTQTVEVEAAQEVQADGEGAPGEDAVVEAVIVEVGERSDLESAETTVEDSAEGTTVSQEAIPALLIAWGIGAAAATALTGYFGHRLDKSSEELQKLHEQVQAKKSLIEKIEYDLHQKAIANKAKYEAWKESSKVSNEGLEVSQEGVGGAVLGAVYAGLFGLVSWGVGAYFAAGIFGAAELAQLSQIKKLKAEMAELDAKISDKELALIKEITAAERKGVVSAESDTGVAAAVAAAAAFAEGAAGAAEAVAAAVDTGSDVVEEAAVVEAVEAVAEDAGEAAVEAAPDGETVEAVAEVVEGAVEEVVDDEAADDAEMAELEEGIEAGEAHAEKYETEVATMESLIEALQDAQQSGGLSMQSARFFQIGFEGIGTRLTGAPFKNAHGEDAIPSLESFGGTMRRDQATNISMESAKEWLAKIWEVLKKTYAQVKAWLVKFFELVINKGERIAARAAKVKAAAGKLSGVKPKADKIKFQSAAKISLKGQINTGDLRDLVDFAKEAGARNSEASRAILQARQDLRKMVETAAAGGDFTDNKAASGDVAMKGELRSAVFKNPYKSEGGEGFQTDVLPGNVQFAAVRPLSGDDAGGFAGLLFRGWKVIEQQAEGAAVADEVPVLTAHHIGEIADAATAVVAAVKAAKAELKEEALSLTDLTFPEGMDDHEARKIKAVAWATGKIVQSQSSSIGKVLKYCINTSDAYLDYAVASLKQYGAEAPAEAAAPAAAAA